MSDDIQKTQTTTTADEDSVLKKSGVEILEDNASIDSVPSTADSAEKLKHEFESELHSTPTMKNTTDGLTASLQHLADVKGKLEREEKMLEAETQRDIEALKKTKAMIEEKIARLKELEQKVKTVDTEMAEVKDLDARMKKVQEDASKIQY